MNPAQLIGPLSALRVYPPQSSGSSIPTEIWANRPTVGVETGARLYVSDLNYNEFIFNGTWWYPATGKIVLMQQNTGQVLTGTTDETFLGTFTLPSGFIVEGCTLYAHWTATVTTAPVADPATVRVAIADKVFSEVQTGTSANAVANILSTIRFTNFDRNIQIGLPLDTNQPYGVLAGPGVDGDQNMNVPRTVYFTGQLGNVDDVLTINGVSLEVSFPF